MPNGLRACSRLHRSSAQPEAGSRGEELRTGPESARLPRGAQAVSRDGARSTPTSARDAPVPIGRCSAAKQWLKAQGRQGPAGSNKHRSGGDSAGAAAGQRDGTSADCEEERTVLVAAAAGYEGEAAVVAIAHIMQQGLSPHEALVAASQRHVALHVRTHPLCDLLVTVVLPHFVAGCHPMRGAQNTNHHLCLCSSAQADGMIYCCNIEGGICCKAEES